MPTARDCPACGSPLPVETPEGLCPKCLLQAGLGAMTDLPAFASAGVGGEHHDPPGTGAAPDPEATITRLPFRVRYFGDYELRAEIAQGGMGIVYRARQVSLDRPVALKMILPDRLDDEAVRRFRQEAESAANLDHPNIVQVYEVGRHEDQHFFSMKLIDGLSLKDELPRFRKDRRAAARLMATVARAVHHAHQRGVLHRDLKPHNILIDRDGQPHVTDFGLAKRVAAGREVTQTGAWAGTPEYMAPEQAAGEFKSLTTAADIYSLGAILYTLLAGQPPFRGPYPAVLRRIVEEEPARPRALDRGVDPDLETICLKCLEKDPNRRYATAAELADDLDRWLAGEPIAARPVSRWERAWKWVRRKPAIAALSAAVFLIGLLGLAGVLWQWRAAIEALGLARKIAYAAHISLAQREWEDNNVVRARELLENPDEAEFRGFEWHYLTRLYYPERLTLKPDSEPGSYLTSVAFSPDGKRLATASSGWKRTSADGKQVVWPGGATVHLWDAATGKPLLTLDGIPASISGGQFITTRGPDGRVTPPRFATRAEFDAAKRNPRDLLSFGSGSYSGSQIAGVAFSPDGQLLAAGSRDATVKVWDAATGKERLVLKGHTRDVIAVSFSPDGRRIASESADRTVKLWDAASGRELLTLKGHPRPVHGVSFSPDGQLLASASGATVKLWDAASGHERLTIKAHARDVRSVAFSPDGQRIASAGDDATIRLWDAASGHKLLEWHAGSVSHLAFRPDGQRLAAAGGGTVRLWDAASGHDLFTFKGHTSGVVSVAFSPDGRRLATASQDRTVKLWDAAGDEARLTLKEHAHHVSRFRGGDVRRVAFSPDGQRLAAAGRGTTVTLWNALTGREQRTFQGHSQVVTGVAFSPDGQRLASASEDQTIKLWDIASGQELRTLKGHPSDVRSVTFSPDGRRLASAGADNSARLWDTATGKELLTLRGQPDFLRGIFPGSAIGVSGVAFRPDGQRLAATTGVGLLLFDTATGKQELVLKPDARLVAGVAFSPDGQRIAASSGRAMAKLWDAGSGRELLALRGHTNDVMDVAFSPDGRRLATASQDRTVKLWDTATGQELLTFKAYPSDRPGAGAVMGVAFSPDGRRLAAISRDHTVRIWMADER